MVIDDNDDEDDDIFHPVSGFFACCEIWHVQQTQSGSQWCADDILCVLIEIRQVRVSCYSPLNDVFSDPRPSCMEHMEAKSPADGTPSSMLAR